MTDAAGQTTRAFALAAMALAAVSLPACEPKPSETPSMMHVGIDTSGALNWNGEAVTTDQLKAHLAEAVKMTPKPEVSIEPVLGSPYAKSSELFEILSHYDIRAVIIGGT